MVRVLVTALVAIGRRALDPAEMKEGAPEIKLFAIAQRVERVLPRHALDDACAFSAHQKTIGCFRLHILYIYT